MIRKLERWVWVGGALLAFNGGIVNAIGIASAARQPVSHVTGTSTSLSLAIVHLDWVEASRLGMIVLCFAGGAMLAGLIVESGALKFGHKYALALWTECGLLCASAGMLEFRPYIGLAIAAAACGLQNALAGTYSGATLRTTHMTGIVTDLGAALGHLLRKSPMDWLRVRFHAMLLSPFLLGAAAGGVLFIAAGSKTMWLPAALTAGIALAYSRILKVAQPVLGAPAVGAQLER